MKIKNESNTNIESGLEKTWDDIVKEVNDEGYFNSEISDILTNKEQMQVYQKIDDINERFSKVTGLSSNDVKFLFFATELQCLRQYLISNDKFRFNTDKAGDNFVGKFVPRKYEDILLGSVPYDTVRKVEGYKDKNTGISGANHRYMTLGHDPILGQIFCTLNIMTNTLTKMGLPIPIINIISPDLSSKLLSENY